MGSEKTIEHLPALVVMHRGLSPTARGIPNCLIFRCSCFQQKLEGARVNINAPHNVRGILTVGTVRGRSSLIRDFGNLNPQ